MPRTSIFSSWRFGFGVLVVVTAALAIASVEMVTRRATDARRTAPAATADKKPAVLVDRAVYRYSVIPGGVYNEGELQSALEADPFAAAHYAQLDRSRLRTEIVGHDRLVHVSYRKGNEIFWTKNKVLLKQGETILTDGKTQIRARCGNCVAEQPLGATGNDEPDVLEFDRLVDGSRAITPETVQGPIAPPASPEEGDRGLLDGFGGNAGGTAAATGGTPDPLAWGLLGGTPDPYAPGGDELPSSPHTPSSGGTTPGPVIDLPEFLDPLRPNEPMPIDRILPPVIDPDGPGSPDPGIPPVNPVPVPEPGTILLVGGGVATLVRRLRSRARRHTAR